MALVTSSNKKSSPNTLNTANLNQLNNIFENSKNTPKKTESADSSKIEIETVTREEPATPEVPVIQSSASKSEKAPKKERNYTDTVILNLPKGERAEFKSFCAKYQLTMTDFIYFAMDYIRNGVSEGKYSVSRGGIKEL